MNRPHYFKFAIANLKNNSKTILPFTLASAISVLLFYNCINIAFSDTTGSGTLSAIFGVCVFLLGVFSSAFLFYTNGFLLKRRKKEFGLYNILGLQKRHISMIILIENAFIFIASIILGLLLGILFSRILIFTLYSVIKFDLHYEFEVNFLAVVYTFLFYCFIFLLLSIYNIIVVYNTKIVNLLKSSKISDKTFKSNYILLIIGVILLISGYTIALSFKNIIFEMDKYALAIILVSVATFCLFSVLGSTVLKALRFNKKFYYRPENFTAVSGLMHRISKNVGALTLICILSTGIIIALSTTVSMYLGINDILNFRYSHDYKIDIVSEDMIDDKIDFVIENVNSEFNEIEDIKYYTHFYFFGSKFNEFIFYEENEDGGSSIEEPNSDDITLYVLMNVSGYEAITNNELVLKDNEILLANEIESNEFNLLNKTYDIVKTNPSLITMLDEYAVYSNIQVIVMNNQEFISFHQNSENYSLKNSIYFNSVKEIDFDALYNVVNENISDVYSIEYIIKADNVKDFYSIYGGLLFVGIFLGLLMLFYVLLILYYKQVVEGYEDRDNYKTMEKIGMSKEMIKRSINRQIIFVFLIPIITAVIHLFFAYNSIIQMLRVFNLTNTDLFMKCTIGVIIVFFIIYLLMYYFTSKIYHKIISES